MLGLNQLQKSNQKQSNEIGEVVNRSKNIQSVRNGESRRNYKNKNNFNNNKPMRAEVGIEIDINKELANSVNQGDLEKAEMLLKSGANANLKDNTGNTLILNALSKNNKEMVKLLILHNANPDIINASGESAVHCSIKNKNFEIGKVLIGRSKEIDKKSTAIVSELLKAGVKLDNVNIFGENALLVAAKTGNVTIMGKLINKGMDINFKNTKTGKTSLHLGAQKGHFAMAKYLIEKKANLEVKDNGGNTAIFDVVPKPNYFFSPRPTKEQSDIAKLLINSNASIEQYETDNFYIGLLADTLNVKHPDYAKDFLFSRVGNEWEKNEERRVSALLDQFASDKNINEKNIDKVLLKLLHPDINYKDEVEATRHSAHLRSWNGVIDKGEKGKIEAEGWWMHIYPPLKAKSLILSLNKIKNSTSIDCKKEFGQSKEKVINKIKHEIAAQMSTYYTQRHHDMMSIISEIKFRNKFKHFEVKKYCKEIVKVAENSEWSMASGFPGHAMYIGFRKTDSDNVARIAYNLGAGANVHKFNPEGKVFPHVVKNIKIDHFINETPEAINYLSGIIEAKLGKFNNDPIQSIYYNIKLLGGTLVTENIPGIAQKRQLVGNCVLKNNNAAARNRIKNDQLFNWLKKEETIFADEFSKIDKEIITKKEFEKDVQSFNHVIKMYNGDKNVNNAMINALTFLEKRSSAPAKVTGKLREPERIAYYLNHMKPEIRDRLMNEKGALKMFSDISNARFCDTLKDVVDLYKHDVPAAAAYMQAYGVKYGRFK